jgi:3-(3-hydroxy-phenyl)propionate hydroxylase
MSWLSSASLASWRQLGGERVVIAGSGESSSRDGVLRVVESERLVADWMRDNGVEAVIVRPDRYVFGGAENADQLNLLIRQLGDELWLVG